MDPKPNEMLSPYAAMENNPILKFDVLGDTAWPIKNKWTDAMIQKYRDNVAAIAATYREKGIECTCEDFALGTLIDFASENSLPLTIVNGSGTYSAASDKFSDAESFKNEVQKTTAAKDLQNDKNTTESHFNSAKPGDIFLKRNDKDVATHVQVVTKVTDNKIDIRQGNAGILNSVPGASRILDASNPKSPFYTGVPVQSGSYDLKSGSYSRAITSTYTSQGAGYTPGNTLPTTTQAFTKMQVTHNSVKAFNLQTRSWNFKAF